MGREELAVEKRRDDRADGIPDEPQALSAARAVGGAVTGAMSTGTRAFRSVDRDGDGIPVEPQAFFAL